MLPSTIRKLLGRVPTGVDAFAAGLKYAPMTPAAQRVVDLFEAKSMRWRYFARDLTDTDIASAPPYLMPGLKTLVARAKAEDYFVWFLPEEGRPR